MHPFSLSLGDDINCFDATSAVPATISLPMSKILSKFIVFAPDLPGALSRRLSVREAHLANVRENIAKGFFGTPPLVLPSSLKRSTELMTRDRLDLGGATMTPADSMNGSALILNCKSIEHARELIEADPYYSADVVSELNLLGPFG